MIEFFKLVRRNSVEIESQKGAKMQQIVGQYSGRPTAQSTSVHNVHMAVRWCSTPFLGYVPKYVSRFFDRIVSLFFQYLFSGCDCLCYLVSALHSQS